MKTMYWTVVSVLCLLGICAQGIGCDRQRAEDERYEQQRLREWNGECVDQATLLATNAGSPDRVHCSNKLHRMRVQIATTPSNNNVGALVFCECIRDAGGE